MSYLNVIIMEWFTTIFCLQQPSKKGRSKPNYARPGTNSRKRAQVEYKSAANDKTVKQLLGELYGDRVYLEKLLKETGKFYYNEGGGAVGNLFLYQNVK